MDHPPMGRSYLVVEASCYMALIIVTCKRNSSAGAKYELCVYTFASRAALQQKCVAALQADTFVYLSLNICIYIHVYIYVCLCLCIYNCIYITI